jgi:ribonuclease P protein component
MLGAAAEATFPRAMRLSGKLSFERAYELGVKQTRGPLKVFGVANEVGHARLGLSVSRRVGTAPRRNRIKRLLRESFRLMPLSRAVGYDLVIVVRPHEPLALSAYQKLMGELLIAVQAQWNKRLSRQTGRRSE